MLNLAAPAHSMFLKIAFKFLKDTLLYFDEWEGAGKDDRTKTWARLQGQPGWTGW